MTTEQQGTMRSIKTAVPKVPEIDKDYVETENFEKISKVITTKNFFPILITGPSGVGKTVAVEHACAVHDRPYIRFQFTPETDEDALLGGLRLINGETVFAKGPVITAMEEGAVLLLDEFDRSSNLNMALQGVLEGKPIMIKATGEIIEPAEGFNIIATGNTKGRGTDDGLYSSAGIIDDALLERFPIALDEDYPPQDLELKIVEKYMNTHDVYDDFLCEVLVKWADNSRSGEHSEAKISTRRLKKVVEALAIFGADNDVECVKMATNRFDDSVARSLVTLYEQTKPDIEAARRAAENDDIHASVREQTDDEEIRNIVEHVKAAGASTT